MSRSKGSTGEQLSREMYKSIGPYSTKTLHKNKQDVSYISIGDPYDRSKRDKNPRWSEWCWCFLFVCVSIVVPATRARRATGETTLFVCFIPYPRITTARARHSHISLPQPPLLSHNYCGCYR